MRKKLTILGGSTPFTAALVDAIAIENELSSRSIMLYGRNLEHLSLVCRYAASRLGRLGWTVSCTTDLAGALTGSHIVVHQIRYGDMAGRAKAEEISIAAGIAPDETLGPGALLAALRQLRHLDRLAAAVRQHCPNAWFLNLTNPLSIVVYRLTRQGVKNCVGLCELPRVTVRQAAAILGKNPDRAQWRYIGLNHRGFVVGLSWHHRNRTKDLAHKLGEDTLGSVSGHDIISLGVIPTKYFSLYLRPKIGRAKIGRADSLTQLRQQIIMQMRQDMGKSPPALRKRYLAWYPDAVVPMIKALSSSKSTLQEVNKMTRQGIVEEGRAQVSNEGVGPILPASVGPEASKWLEKIRRHEQAVLAATEHPDKDSIARALTLDPMVPENQIQVCLRRIWHEFNQGLAEK